MLPHPVWKNLLMAVLLWPSVTAALGQSDSLMQALTQLDSSIRANHIRNNNQVADSLLETALSQSKTGLGATSLFYAYFSSQKGQALIDRGLHQNALQPYEEARRIYQQFPTDSNRIGTLIKLGQLYAQLGPLKNAQDALLEAEEVMNLPGSWPKGLPQILIWDVKAKIYLKLFDFKQALTYQQRVVDRYKEVGGNVYDQFYPEAATTLAFTLSFLQRDQEALSQLDNVSSYLQNQRRVDDPVMWKVYIARGQINLRQHDDDRAEANFLQALLLVTRQSSVNSPWTVITYNLLASFYQTSKKDADRAEYYYELSRSGLTKKGAMNDFLTARALNDLAALHVQKGLYRQAATELAESQRLIRVEQQSNFGFTATRQKEIDVRYNQEPFINTLRFTAYQTRRGEKPDTLFRQLSYDAALYLNGLLLEDARQIRQTLVGSRDTVVRQLYTKWAGLKQYAADSLGNSLTRAEQLKQEIDLLEQQMARQSTTYATDKAKSRVDWRQISRKLLPGDAAIAFVRFPAFDSTSSSADSILYAALIVRPKQVAPDMVVLCSERQLLAALGRRRQLPPSYASRGTELIGNERLTEASKLYRLLWQPLAATLRNVKRVYYSPGGLLHGVSFAGLRIPVGKTASPQYLTDRYELRQLFSTRDVAAGIRPLRGSAGLSALLVGGVDYGSSATTPFAALPGSGREVSHLGKLLPRATLLTGTLAQEARIKAVSGRSPTMLHLATHGFYQPDYTATNPVSSTDTSLTRSLAMTPDPLYRSGLALAGANQASRANKGATVANDGILTAYEVAVLDLSQTRLVVLSACETALGDVQGAEGVYGLQRAFRLAGAEKLVVSLRPVPDQATQQLMTLFYRYLQKGAEVHTALRQAQYRLRRQYPNPAIWAAFVLIE